MTSDLELIRAIADPLERQRAALGELEEAREEWKRQAGRWATVRAEAVCCGAPVEPVTYSPRGDGTVTRWRCSQCGLTQDPR